MSENDDVVVIDHVFSVGEFAARPLLRVHARSIADNVAESTGQPVGAIAEILLVLVQAFLPMLAKLLPCLNPQPVPPDPNPSPTPESTLAWKNAWALKGRAEKAFNERRNKYDRHTLHQMSQKIVAQKRKNQESIGEDEALSIARNALDEAREKSQHEIAATILEAQGK